MEQLSLWHQGVEVPIKRVASRSSPRQAVPCTAKRNALRLSRWLGGELQRPVRIEFTANRSTMLSSREDGVVLTVRLHRSFIDAPEGVWRAVADYVGSRDQEAGCLLDAFIAQQASLAPREPSELRPRGRCFDLEVLMAELNARFFHNASQARITWGSAGTRRRRRSIQLGCYIGTERLIRIHPCLDQSFVPRYYVAWVVFHEMLHEVFGVGGHGRRRTLHPPEFAAVEQTFPEYQLCQRWEKENLDRLLRFRPPRQGRD